MTKCDCGKVFAEKDIVVVDRAGADYYPYEGEVYTFCCPACGYLTTVKGDEVSAL
jgi:hypothetical protein